MPNQFNRKDFIKLTSMAGIGLWLSSCGLSEEETQEKLKLFKRAHHFLKQRGNEKSDNVLYIAPADADYDKLRQGFNKRFDKKPALIALCKNTQGVVEAVQYARKNKMPIAVKSGGHSFEGYSSNDGGMVINMSLMSGVEWLDNNQVKIGPGCTLSKLYDNILPKKRIIPAGSCGGVGVGGLTLGGGYGFFSRKYGLTCDNLLEFTMVDGNGTIRSSKDDPELLWACRGGGNGNFGIVTEMIFQTHEAPDTFQSHRFKAYKLDVTRAQNILKEWFHLSAGLPEAAFAAFVLNGNSLTILVTNYETHNDNVQAMIDGLSPLCDKTTVGTPVALAGALKNYYGVQHPLYFKNASAGLYTGYEQLEGFISEILQKVVTTPGLIYQVNTLGGKINNADFASVSCYPHRTLPYLSELQTYWEKEGAGENYIKVFREVQQMFVKNNINTQYVNYPDLELENWQQAFFGNNYSGLQKIKAKYDPENNIQHAQSISVAEKS